MPSPVFYASNLSLMIKLRHNIVKVVVEPGAAGEWFRAKLGQCYDVIYLE